MAITAKIDADYSAFFDATAKAEVSLKSLDKTANQTGKMLEAMGDGYTTAPAVAATKQLEQAFDGVASSASTKVAPALDKVETATGTAALKGNEFKESFGQVDKTLAAAGVSLGPIPGMLDELSAAAGKSVTELGALGTAGAVAAAAMAGWSIGKKIDEWTGWSDAIARTTAKLMGWGDVAAMEAAAGADTLARASALAGKEITDMAVALRILGDAAAAAAEEDKKLAADIKLSEAAAAQFGLVVAKLFGYDDINRAEQYRAALGGVENVTKLTTEKKKELHKVVEDALAAYAALGTTAPKALQDILRATTELIPVTKSFSAANSGAWAEFAVGMEDGKKKMAEIAAAAKLSWEDIGGTSRAMLEQIATDAEEKYSVAQEHSDHFTAKQLENFRKAATEARAAADNWGSATLEAYDAISAASGTTADTQIANAQRASAATVTSWHEAMSAVAAGQGTMGGTVGGAIDTGPAARASIQKAYDEGRYYGPVVNVSETNPRGTGPNWSALGFRASGGPVTAGQPYMVGERGPELFVPRESGTVQAHGAGLTVNNTIMVTGGTETLARQVADEIMRTIRAGTQLGTA